MPDYDFNKIEKKWSEKWLKDKTYEPLDFARGKPDLDKAKKPFYNLMMFPYPSAEGLHVGNMYAFTGADIYGRKKRMEGKDVFEPIGLDGFGIHSENYALKIGKHPKKLAQETEKRFYEQLKMIGNGFSWDERLETYDPEYYKWTQWIFVQMFKRGLAYRKKASVNWCAQCLTVLADEQVLAGECERCGTKVIKKELEQWFFKITDYAERLLNDIEKIDWSKRIKIAQKNWIGKSEGALIKFPLKAKSLQLKVETEVFTTRPDTLFGATYLVLSPEHPWLTQEILNSKSEILNKSEIRNYIEKSKAKTEEERIAERGDSPSHKASAEQGKTGVELKGIKAINPATKEEIPIWIADYVLAGYGTGAIMAVPAHDQRDFEFAQKFGLEVREVIRPVYGEPHEGAEFRRTVTAIVQRKSDGKFLVVKWNKFNWVSLPIGGIDEGETAEETAVREVFEETGHRVRPVKKLGGEVTMHFFAENKNVWRHRLDQPVLLELVDENQTERSIEEKEKLEPVWMSGEELIRSITHEYNVIGVKRFLGFELAYQGRGELVNSGVFDGMDSEKAKREITKFVGGEIKSQYHLRDWLISRQRYWGPPIPMIFCPACANSAFVATSAKEAASAGKKNAGWQPVPEKDLPVLLPDIKNFRPTGTDKSPLATVEEFVKAKCPKCGGEARRETDVSDTFLDSAWYFFRYIDHENKQEAFSRKLAKRWLPVDMYIGGAEHAVLHLLYTRFLTKVFYDWGLIDFDEPFKKFRAHGLLIKDGAKMSKSKGNVVNPDDYINKFGADTLRMYLMFLGPFDEGGDFRDESIAGAVRFLNRVWKLKEKITPSSDGVPGRMTGQNPKLEIILNQSIKKIGDDIEKLHYNTAISQLMILLSSFENGCDEKSFKIFLKLLAPFAPFLVEELWHKLGESESIHTSKWPEYDESKIKEEMKTIIVQINGKVREKFEISSKDSDEEIKIQTLNLPKIKEFLGGKNPQKIIVARNRLVNIVLAK
ncbi:MAG: class I tRNA ligase family protein [Candidatus Niyogibacteria bacterium]|nr:MAG: class I tRNA ligase family protein [Candidatus Niyogibacteria bacterium]